VLPPISNIEVRQKTRNPEKGGSQSVGAPPYNNGIKQIARGRHALCFLRGHMLRVIAKVLPVPSGLVRPGQSPPAVLTAYPGVIRTIKNCRKYKSVQMLQVNRYLPVISNP
jgi:hypothetical protein